MLLSTRTFQRREPGRSARTIYVISEGRRTEPGYFGNFRGLDSRVRIEIIAPDPHENNSPTGLLAKARALFEGDGAQLSPKYELEPDDELWFVIDTDEWGPKIGTLYEACAEKPNWNIAQSNPCFEVWLYYHLHDQLPEVGKSLNSQEWKKFLRAIEPEKFHPQRHYLFIGTAIQNAKRNYSESNGQPLRGATAMFKPAQSIYEIAHKKIDRLLEQSKS